MPLQITRRYHFEAAHWLPGVPETHKCHRIHGHNYHMDVTVEGMQDNKTGFIVDFWDLDTIIEPIIKRVDHYMLNDVAGLENPTAENIARWFYGELFNSPLNQCLKSIRIYETLDCWADYSKE